LQNERVCVQVIDPSGGCGEVQDRFFYPVDSDGSSMAVVVADVTHIYVVSGGVRAGAGGNVLAVLYTQGEGGVAIEIINSLQMTVGGDGEEAAGVTAVVVRIIEAGVCCGRGDAGSLVHTRVFQEMVGGFPQMVVAGCQEYE